MAMSTSELLGSEDPTAKLVDALCTSLRRRQIVGSRNVALATAALIHTVVRSIKFATLDDLLALLKLIGRQLNEANPKELAAGNVIRKILRLFREEYRAAAAAHISQPATPPSGPETPGLHAPANHYLSKDLSMSSPEDTTTGDTGVAGMSSAPSYGVATPSPGMSVVNLPSVSRALSLSNFVAMRHSRAQLERSGSSLSELSHAASYFGSSSWISQEMSRRENEEFMKQSAKLKPVLVQAIEEVIGELESTHEDVAKGAREHIHSSEVILTLGHSRTVEAFLKHAYRDRKFMVIVVESAPSFLGQSMAQSLSSSSIPTLLVPDSAIYALMPRVTKVILGAHSILANGGLFALSGSLSACLAAKAHSKPVVVTTGQFKFAPVWNLYHEYGAVDFQSPDTVLNSSSPSSLSGAGAGGGKGDGAGSGGASLNPYYEYIRPELINLFVTNEGDHSPSYIYRIIKEAYDEEDVEI